MPEQGLVLEMRQTLVEKDLGDRQNHAAVDVVLHLAIGVIADAYRAHAAVARQLLGPGFGELGLAVDAVDRLQRVVLGVGDQIDDVVEIVLHDRGRAEPVERADHEIRVAQPAVAIIPVALGVRGLGDRGGHGRDHRAGFGVGRQLQRDRRADNGLLPVVGDRQRAHPVAPVIAGLLEEASADFRRRFEQGFIGGGDQRMGAVRHESALVEDIADRYVGGQPQHARVRHIAQMVRAARDADLIGAVVADRAHAHSHARRAGQVRDLAHDHQRPEFTPVLPEMRHEIGQPDRATARIPQRGLQDGGIAQIFALDRDAVVDPDLVVAAILVIDQLAEQRVALKIGETTPDDASLRIDQGRDLAVADQTQIQVGGGLAVFNVAAICCSHSNTSSTVSSRYRAALEAGSPTRIDTPPSEFTATNAASSVTSSPT